MDYKLFKQLKECGYPFKEAPLTVCSAKDRSLNDGKGELIIFDDIPDLVDKVFYEPTLEEVIEELGGSLCSIYINDKQWGGIMKGGWIAATWDSKKAEGKTPLEAVCNLYIKLNKK